MSKVLKGKLKDIITAGTGHDDGWGYGDGYGYGYGDGNGSGSGHGYVNDWQYAGAEIINETTNKEKKDDK